MSGCFSSRVSRAGKSRQTIRELGSAEGLIAVQATSWPFNLRATPRLEQLALTPGSKAPSSSTVSKSTLPSCVGVVFKCCPPEDHRSHSPFVGMYQPYSPGPHVFSYLLDTTLANSKVSAQEACGGLCACQPIVSQGRLGTISVYSLVPARSQRPGLFTLAGAHNL